MKEEIMLALAAKWERDAIEPESQESPKDDERKNDVQHGVRKGLRKCAKDLRALSSLLC